MLEADAKGVEYCYAEVRAAGRPAAEVLAERLGGLIKSIAFRKSMRWNSGLSFSRPVRWLLALHGPCPVPASLGPLVAGSTTRLLRGAEQAEAVVPSAADYLEVLEAGNISLVCDARKEDIWAGVCAAAAGVGGAIPTSAKGDLLAEVSNLVESPTVVLGTFEERFLVLPRELLVMVMRKHQVSEGFPGTTEEGWF